jgi:RNA polymerase sigma factor (sigma-70 family)
MDTRIENETVVFEVEVEVSVECEPAPPAGKKKRRRRRRPAEVQPEPARPPLTTQQQGLAADYFPFARALANRYRRRWQLDRDECDSAACMALVEAAQSYDASMNVKFTTWVKRRVLSRLHDVRHGPVMVGYARPDEAPLVLPLVQDVEEYGRVLMCTPDPPVCAEIDARERLEGLMQRLPVRHAETFERIYMSGLSQQDTAESLGLSQARICRLHKQSVEMLNDSLTWKDRFLRAAALRALELADGDPLAPEPSAAMGGCACVF